MNNELVKLSMDKNLRDTYEGLVNLMYVSNLSSRVLSDVVLSALSSSLVTTLVTIILKDYRCFVTGRNPCLRPLILGKLDVIYCLSSFY